MPDLELLGRDPRHPNGKSQKDAIAQSEHDKALKDAEELAPVAVGRAGRHYISQNGYGDVLHFQSRLAPLQLSPSINSIVYGLGSE